MGANCADKYLAIARTGDTIAQRCSAGCFALSCTNCSTQLEAAAATCFTNLSAVGVQAA